MSTNEESHGLCTTLTFGLHPNRSLRISLHENVNESDAKAIAARAVSYVPESGNREEGRYALMDAERVVSINHIGVAGSMALGRCARWGEERSTSAANVEIDSTNSKGNIKRWRGIGQDTVVCAAGTSHAGYALRDYAFLPQDEGKPPSSSSITTTSGSASFSVLAIGFDCQNDTEYETFLACVGLGKPSRSSRENLMTYFSRQRSNEELASLSKAYKISQNEINMDGSSLEDAVITRVATKFAV